MTTVEGEGNYIDVAVDQHETRLVQYELSGWSPQDVGVLRQLEEYAWPPWLQKKPEDLATIAWLYPDLQQKATAPGLSMVVGSMTLNRIQINSTADLRTWDEVAGGPVNRTSNNVNAFDERGNTLCVISSSIDPIAKHTGLGPMLLAGAIEKAQNLEGITQVVGPFRPTGWGTRKLKEIEQHGRVITSFGDYCRERDPASDGPVDRWLSSAEKIGMIPIKVAPQSMVVEVPRDKFDEYQTGYRPGLWVKSANGTWECGETGSWREKNWDKRDASAVYTEPNLWGRFRLSSVGEFTGPLLRTRLPRKLILP